MRRGFTILEVLAALVIFAGAAVGLTTAYIGVLDAYAHVRTTMQADEDAKLSRAALFSQPDPALAAQGDEFDVIDASNRSRHVAWTAQIDYTEVADLFDVTLTTAVTQPNELTTTSSETLRLLRPTWSDASARTELQNTARQKLRELIADRQQNP
jgi:prepilin-type N-terminal cleavage/methylation domain-containing protein